MSQDTEKKSQAVPGECGSFLPEPGLRHAYGMWTGKQQTSERASLPPPLSPPPRWKLCSDSRSFSTGNLKSPAKTNPRWSGLRSPKYLFAPACLERYGIGESLSPGFTRVFNSHLKEKKTFILPLYAPGQMEKSSCSPVDVKTSLTC